MNATKRNLLKRDDEQVLVRDADLVKFSAVGLTNAPMQAQCIVFYFRRVNSQIIYSLDGKGTNNSFPSHYGIGNKPTRMKCGGIVHRVQTLSLVGLLLRVTRQRYWRYYRGIHGITAGMGINFTVLPRYWVQNIRESRGNGVQAYGTTAVMGLILHRELARTDCTAPWACNYYYQRHQIKPRLRCGRFMKAPTATN